MRVGELKRQIEEWSENDEVEVVLDTEDGNFGIASVYTEGGRLVISTGDPEEE